MLQLGRGLRINRVPCGIGTSVADTCQGFLNFCIFEPEMVPFTLASGHHPTSGVPISFLLSKHYAGWSAIRGDRSWKLFWLKIKHEKETCLPISSLTQLTYFDCVVLQSYLFVLLYINLIYLYPYLIN